MITTLTIDIDTAPKTILIGLADVSENLVILHELSMRNEWEVLLHVAQNTNTSHITLSNISKRVHELKMPRYIRVMIQGAIICNPATYPNTIDEILSKDGKGRIFVCNKGKHYFSLNELALECAKNISPETVMKLTAE